MRGRKKSAVTAACCPVVSPPILEGSSEQTSSPLACPCCPEGG
eukprot:CAMPEP_0172641838 /NCGR_PEP_ID=MMETSP1068-20121228/229316_1 /TAXON_ID=35684 /ORGANISM="Pseudopedinella elastica, Strain CCMP716" /LENGTH=42 /DNA_ID= /DNA_START= /DNA_END= /DNA_ORIENTATION=